MPAVHFIITCYIYFWPLWPWGYSHLLLSTEFELYWDWIFSGEEAAQMANGKLTVPPIHLLMPKTMSSQALASSFVTKSWKAITGP